MAVAAVNIEDRQHIARLLSTFNAGITQGTISATTINGANTFATFKARVQANVDAAEPGARQFGNIFLIPALTGANVEGILTDTNLNSKTTVASVQALYTTANPDLPLGLTGNNLA